MPCSAHHGNRLGTMANNPPKPTKEERLAAKLRENLRRRKAQARAFQADPRPTEENTGDSDGDSGPGGLPKDGANR